MFNTYMENRANGRHNIQFVNITPYRFEHFKKDLIHFNESGSVLFTNQIIKSINYFYSFPQPQATRLT